MGATVLILGLQFSATATGVRRSRGGDVLSGTQAMGPVRLRLHCLAYPRSLSISKLDAPKGGTLPASRSLSVQQLFQCGLPAVWTSLCECLLEVDEHDHPELCRDTRQGDEAHTGGDGQVVVHQVEELDAPGQREWQRRHDQFRLTHAREGQVQK